MMRQLVKAVIKLRTSRSKEARKLRFVGGGPAKVPSDRTTLCGGATKVDSSQPKTEDL